MRRLLFFVIVLYVVWRVLGIIGRRLRRRARGADEFSRFSRRRPRAGAETEPPEELVACSACGTLVPASHALPGPGGRAFCSRACRNGERGGNHEGTTSGPGPAA